MRKLLKLAAVASIAVMTLNPLAAHALVMDFGANPTTTTPFTPFSQNGLTMTPIDTGAGVPHWDRYAGGAFGSPADNVAVIHTGNAAEIVEFTFDAGAFDLLSVLSEGFLLDQDGDNQGAGLDVTFTASSGATYIVSDPFGGLIDFSSLTGWTNITSFSISVPLGVGGCEVPGNDCSNFGFDDVTFIAHVPENAVPEPMTLSLLGAGLAGIGLARRRPSLRFGPAGKRA